MSVVVPVFNAIRFLPITVPSLLGAAHRAGGTEVIFVDNGSADGSYELLREQVGADARVLRLESASIAAVRNFGARHATGDFLSFLDADCVVDEAYFVRAPRVLAETGAVATGCQVQIPAYPHWIEETWHFLHFVGRNRDVQYLNSGNFFISRAAFQAVGGFDESLPTGEDAEIGRRIVESGRRIRECPAVGAVHLGNPNSVRQFYRRSVWHALGMFGTVGGQRLDRPTAMMFAHLAATLAGVGVVTSGALPLAATLGAVTLLQLAVPAATVAFRWKQVGRVGRLGSGLALYWLYYLARLQGLVLILGGRGHRYRK